MRKKDREIRDPEEILDILARASVCRIGLCDGDLPYVVPVCFGHRDGGIYIHSSSEGKKIDIIRQNNNVCFEVEVDVELVTAESACRYTMKFKSVIGFGKAHIVEDPDEKKKGLDIIMEHYSGSADHEYTEKGFDLATIIRIDIQRMTGKRSKQ